MVDPFGRELTPDLVEVVVCLGATFASDFDAAFCKGGSAHASGCVILDGDLYTEHMVPTVDDESLESETSAGVNSADGSAWPVEEPESRLVPARIVVPTVDHRLFRRELTPTWIATVAGLRGDSAPRLEKPDIAVAYLGGAQGVTAAVVAATHPDATVWIWDHRPEAVEFATTLADAVDLPNLDVHQSPRLPDRLGVPRGSADPRPLDLVVVDRVLDVADQLHRQRIVQAIERSLRPGGVVAAAYRTVIGWAEIDPLIRLLRYVALNQSDSLIAAVNNAVSWLTRLRDLDAAYIANRPVARAWIDEIESMKPEQVVADYLDQDLTPVSFAQVSDVLGSIGCHFAGSAILDEGLAEEDVVPFSRELGRVIAAQSSSVVRETFSDLAVRRLERTDLYRLGRSTSAVHRIRGVATPPWGHVAVMATGRPELQSNIGPNELAVLMAQGEVHPSVQGEPDKRAVEASRRLTDVIGRLIEWNVGTRLKILPQFQTAIVDKRVVTK